MKNFIEYKGYSGSVEYSDEDKCLFGKVLGIRSLISYEGQSVEELKKSFEFMIDEYLADCASKNQEPEKPFKGSLNVRLGSDTHRILALQAQEKQMTINSYIKEIINQYINQNL